MLQISHVKLSYVIANVVGVVFLGMAMQAANMPAFLPWLIGIVFLIIIYACQIPKVSAEDEFLQIVIFIFGLIAEAIVVGWVLPVILGVWFLAQGLHALND